MKSWFQKNKDFKKSEREIESPDFLPSPPMRGKGIRRLNNNPAILAFVLSFITLVAIGYAWQSRLQKEKLVTQNEDNDNDAVGYVNTEALFGKIPRYGVIQSSVNKKSSEKDINHSSTSITGDNLQKDLRVDPLQQEIFETQKRLFRKKIERWEQALVASTEVSSNNDFRLNDPLPREASLQNVSSGDKMFSNTDRFGSGEENQNRQAQKNAWLYNIERNEDYLKNSQNAAFSPYELKAGSVIPCVMIGGINSDLPGQIIGQVREDVYDSATGHYLLIPKGARLTGVYDSQITIGQKRILVGWNRIIYPDGSSINIQKMPGADNGGYAGLHDKVDNHYLRIYGNAFLLSIFSAGIQLSQPRGTGESYNSSQIIAGALGQELGQLGMEMTRRNMNIQPTLRVRNGATFNIMVTKDMILNPWEHLE